MCLKDRIVISLLALICALIMCLYLEKYLLFLEFAAALIVFQIVDYRLLSIREVLLYEKVKKIFDKYENQLLPITIPDEYENVYDFLRDHPEFEYQYQSEIDDAYLNKKYKKYIPKGMYGVSVGDPIIPIWMVIIDEILELFVKHDPKLDISQIKLKWGGIRFYVYSEKIEDRLAIEILINNKLFDKSLIY